MFVRERDAESLPLVSLFLAFFFILLPLLSVTLFITVFGFPAFFLNSET